MADTRSYDDRDGFIWFDGKLVPWREANVHVLTHALHYASAVFEGERAYGGQIFELTQHSQRLYDGAKVMDFTIPYSVAEIDRACRDTIKANNLTDCYVRPIAWRGSEQMGVSAQATKIQAAGLYMICTIEKHRAERAGYADALMYDWRGHVAECTGANIFFVKDGVLHTPTPDCFLDGITRRTVIGLAKKRGLQVVDRTIMPAELGSFSECFIVGTAAEVTPVSEIAEHKYTPGKISETLIHDYSAAVQPKKV